MNVDWDEEICGVRMIRIRDLMREIGSLEVDLAWVSGQLKLSGSKTETIVAQLIEREWIERVELPLALNPRYKIADDGRSLAAARALPRITRVKAEQILKGFMRRVEDVNDDDDFGMYVHEVYLFGSFLDPSKERLGDLDLIVSLLVRRIVGRRVSDYEFERQKLAGAKGWFSDFLAYEVKRYLKARDPHISFGSAILLDMPIPKLLIYSAPPEVSLEHEHRGQERPWENVVIGRGEA
jgi:predicted nucleotidyltransferase